MFSFIDWAIPPEDSLHPIYLWVIEWFSPQSYRIRTPPSTGKSVPWGMSTLELDPKSDSSEHNDLLVNNASRSNEHTAWTWIDLKHWICSNTGFIIITLYASCMVRTCTFNCGNNFALHITSSNLGLSGSYNGRALQLQLIHSRAACSQVSQQHRIRKWTYSGR